MNAHRLSVTLERYSVVITRNKMEHHFVYEISSCKTDIILYIIEMEQNITLSKKNPNAKT